MKLTKVQVRDFKNILESTPVEVERDITCLVGKNESGKTALLQAIFRLKPAYAVTFKELDDYPRWLLSEHRITGEVGKAHPIEAVFDLEEDDIAAVEAVGGKGVLGATKEITVYKDYANKTYVTFGKVFEGSAVAKIVDGVQLSDGLRVTIGTHLTFEDLNKRLVEVEGDIPKMDVSTQPIVTEAIAQIRGNTAAQFPKGTAQAIRDQLAKQVPTFFYFSEYSQLEGKVDLEKLFGGGELTESQQTARSLLRRAHADNKSLLAQDYEERKSELEAVANRLTQEVTEYWTQSSDLGVQIDVEMAAPAAVGGPMVAKYLQIRVEDRRHGFTNRFDQRSSGFRWFFSFLAAFHEFENRKERVVILLDEPALTLHAKAQGDFLRFINQRLAPKHQVVYTTHSPFMVEAGHLERVRVVEDKGRAAGGVVSADVLSTDPDTLFPLQAALGYDIAQTLFMGADNLLVEGTSDYTYLSVMSDFLKDAKRAHLDPRWRMVPAGGATNIPTFVALLGNRLAVTVLVDAGTGTQKVTDLAKAGYLKPKRLLTIAEITGTSKADVEDLFDIEDYLHLYNQAEGKNLKAGDLPPGDRILDKINRKEGSFEHGRPADFLLRNRDKVLPSLRPATLDRFEALFKRINETLD